MDTRRKSFMKNLKVVKGNTMIKNSNIDLSLAERRIFNTAVSMVNPTDVNSTMSFTICAREYAKMIGQDISDCYRNIERASKKLLRQQIFIYEGHRDKHGERMLTVYNICSSATYYKVDKKIKIKLNEDVRPILCGIKKEFTQFKLSDSLKLGSLYSSCLFELYSCWKSLGTFQLTIKEIREKFSIDEKKYKRTNSFILNVIEKPVLEINKKLNLGISTKKVRRGKFVNSIIFSWPIPKSLGKTTGDKIDDIEISSISNELRCYFSKPCEKEELDYILKDLSPSKRDDIMKKIASKGGHSTISKSSMVNLNILLSSIEKILK